MTLVFIENAPGSGQVVIVSEAFDDHVMSRRLKPGESVRIAISRFKSIVIDDETLVNQRLADPARQGTGGRIFQPV